MSCATAWGAAVSFNSNSSRLGIVLQITILGDVHYSTGERIDSSIIRHHSALILETALDQIARRPQPPDLVVQIGDLIDGMGQSPEETRKDLERAVALFRDSGLRWTWIPGNHDVAYCGGKKWLLPYMGRPDTYGEMVFGDDVILLLDSAIKEVYGHVDARQMAWLEERLEAHRDRRIFVFIHHVFDWSHEHDMHIENAETIRSILHGARAVKAVFMGHTHAHQVAMNERLPEIVTASLSSWPLLFRNVEIGTDGLRVTSERVVLPPEVDAEAIDAHRAHPKPWRSEPYDADLDIDLPYR